MLFVAVSIRTSHIASGSISPPPSTYERGGVTVCPTD
jgi:hypothetical protein